MVKFFDQKQEVIQIELTPYGRQQLSEGNFSPSYYAFYDTGILYDGAFGGKTETQNQIVERIKNSTPRSRPWTKFSSSSRPISSKASANYKNYFDQHRAYCATYNRFLGKNNDFSDFAPSWDVRVTSNSDRELHEHPEYLSNNTLPVVSASLFVQYSTEESGSSVRYSLLENQNITLDIQELNTIFKVNGNYDLEVFRLGEDNQIHSLSFINPNSFLAQSLQEQTLPGALSETIRGNNEAILAGFPILDDTYVEYYFNILLDQEVPGVQMPSNSTIYKSNIDRNPGNICKVITNET